MKSRSQVKTPDSKICCTCLLRKPAADFNHNRSERDGLARRCKSCKYEDHKRRQAARAANYKRVAFKVCGNCGGRKPGSDFYRQTAAQDGVTAFCRSCMDARNRNYYLENREAFHHAALRRYRKNRDKTRAYSVVRRNNARVKQYGGEGSFTSSEWLGLVDYYDNYCGYCNKHEAEVGPLTCDHMLAVSRRGSGYIENIVPACDQCNSSKGAKTILEFVIHQKLIQLLEAQDADF